MKETEHASLFFGKLYQEIGGEEVKTLINIVIISLLILACVGVQVRVNKLEAKKEIEIRKEFEEEFGMSPEEFVETLPYRGE